MIKVFRNIRHQLIDKGNLKSYLLYAIGEIFLVMVGILLALQVNNWNENRKNSIREKQLLNELVTNLNSNLEAFKQNIAAQNEQIRGIDTILDYLEYKKPYQDSLAFYLRPLIYLEQITASKSTYETLKSTGLDLIQSDELRREITQLFEMTYPISINLIRDVAMQRYNQTQSMMLKYVRVNKKRTMAVPIDYNALLKDQIFINWLYDRRGWKVAVINSNQNLIEQTKALLDSIHAYLQDK